MRKIILDTETTGLDYGNDRIIEIACLELLDDSYTEKNITGIITLAISL